MYDETHPGWFVVFDGGECCGTFPDHIQVQLKLDC